MAPRRLVCRVPLLLASAVLLLSLPRASESRVHPGRAVEVSRGEATEATRRELVQYDPQASCDLCQDNWLIVLGAGGRTGSTTALSMLDAIPGFEIAGEHFGLIEDEHHLMQKYQDTIGKEGKSWKHHAPDLLAMRCSIQERMKRMILGADYAAIASSVKVVGFKEVRYQSMGMLNFIHQVFPCARYVFTYRADADAEVRADGFGDQYRKNWLSARDTFSRVHDALQDTHSMFRVEALTTKHWNRVIHDKLGVQGCEYTHILHDNAEGSYARDQTEETLFTAECDLSGLDFRLSPSQLETQEAIWRELYPGDHRWYP